MKKQLLKAFCPFVIMMMISSTVANAQIVYFDVNPDLSFACNGNQHCSKSYSLDLNNDGLGDFIILLGHGCINNCIRSVSIAPDSSVNAFAISSNGAKKFFMNDTIGPAQTWQNSSSAVLRRWGSGSVYAGEWIYETDKYLGLSINVSGLTYYGWVRLDVTVDSVTGFRTIKDYAYNTIPNQPILAGQTMTTGVMENTFASSINLFPNPADNQLTIDFGSDHKKVQVTIADLTGKVVYTTIATDAQTVEVNTTDFAGGMYVVQIQATDFISTKKLAIEK
jgi:hypothetical protein